MTRDRLMLVTTPAHEDVGHGMSCGKLNIVENLNSAQV